MKNKDNPLAQYKLGDLVDLISFHHKLLYFKLVIGSLEVVVCKIIDKFQYTLIDIERKILYIIFHFNRLKQTLIRTTKCPFSTLVDLKQIINSGIRISEQN